MEQLQSHIWLTGTASSYVVKYLRISSYIRKPFFTYDFATDPIWISLDMRKIPFYFLSERGYIFFKDDVTVYSPHWCFLYRKKYMTRGGEEDSVNKVEARRWTSLMNLTNKSIELQNCYKCSRLGLACEKFDEPRSLPPSRSGGHVHTSAINSSPRILLHWKVHKREKFFGSDFEFFTIL